MNKQLTITATKTVEIKQGDIPDVPEKGLVVKLHFAGICHSDAHMYGEPHYKVLLPKILGHEISGTVHQLGKDYKEGKLSKGDRVVVHAWGGCRNCQTCAVSMGHNCDKKDGPHAHVYGVWRNGGYQEYMAVEDPWSVIPVPESIPLDLACLAPCSGVTSYNALENCKDSISRAINIGGHANLLIMGTGGLGIWAIQIAKSLYGESLKVVAADINEQKLQEAKNEGADGTILLPREGEAKEIAEKIKQCFGGEGLDASIDFVNNAITFERIFHSFRTGGTAVMVGLAPSQMPSVPMMPFILRNIRVQGIYAGSKMQVCELFKLITDKKVNGPKIDHVKLEEVTDILDKMLAGTLESTRAVVNYCGTK